MINFDGEADEGNINPEEPQLTRNDAPQSAAASDLVHNGPIECAEHSLLTDPSENNMPVSGQPPAQNQVKLTNYHNLFFAGAPIQRPTEIAHIESQESIIPEAQLAFTSNQWSGFDVAVSTTAAQNSNRRGLANGTYEPVVILNQNNVSGGGSNFTAGDEDHKKSGSPSGDSTLSQSPGLVSPSPPGSGANSQYSVQDSPRQQNNSDPGLMKRQLSHSNSRENIHSTTTEQIVFDCSKHNQQAAQAKINPYNRSSISSYKSATGSFAAQTMYRPGVTSSIAFGNQPTSSQIFRGAQEPEPAEVHYEGSPELFKLINTQKFVLQNNFIPVPSMQTGNKVVTLDINQQQLLTESGENMTQARFLKSRQRQTRARCVPNVLAPLTNVRQQSQEPTLNREVAGSTIFGARIRSDSSGSFNRHDAASDEQGNSSNYSLEEPFVNISDEQLNQTVVEGRDIAILSQYESAGQLIHQDGRNPIHPTVMSIPGTAASIVSQGGPVYSQQKKRSQRHMAQLANNFGFGNVADYSIASQPALNAQNIMNEHTENELQQDIRRNTQQNGRVFAKPGEQTTQVEEKPTPGILVLAPSQVQMQQQSSKRSKRGVFSHDQESEMQYSPASIGSSQSRESQAEVNRKVLSPTKKADHPSKKINKVFTKAIKLKKAQVMENVPGSNQPRASIIEDRQLRKIQVFDQGRRPKFIETVSAQRLSQYSPQSSERSSVDSRHRGSGMSRNSRNSGNSNHSPGLKNMMPQQIQNLSFMFSTSQSNTNNNKFPRGANHMVQQLDKSKLNQVVITQKKHTNQIFQQTQRPDGDVIINQKVKQQKLKLLNDQRVAMATTINQQRRQTSQPVDGDTFSPKQVSFGFGSPADPRKTNTIRVRKMSSNKEAQDQVVNQLIQQHAKKKEQLQQVIVTTQPDQQTGAAPTNFQQNLQSAERSPFKHKNITSTHVSSGNQRYFQPPITSSNNIASDFHMSELGSSVSSLNNNNFQRK